MPITPTFRSLSILSLAFAAMTFWACQEQATQPKIETAPMALRLSPLTSAKRPDSVVISRKADRIGLATLSYPSDSSALITFTAPSDLATDSLTLDIWAGGFVVTSVHYAQQNGNLALAGKQSTAIANWLVQRMDSVLGLQPKAKRDSLARQLLGQGILRGDSSLKDWYLKLPKGLSAQTGNVAALRAIVAIPMPLDTALAQWTATWTRDQAASQLEAWLKDSSISLTQYKAVLGIKDTTPPPVPSTPDSLHTLELKPLSPARMLDSATLTHADTAMTSILPQINGNAATFTYSFSSVHKDILTLKVWTAGIVVTTLKYKWVTNPADLYVPLSEDSSKMALWLLKKVDSILELTPKFNHRTALLSLLGDALSQGDTATALKNWTSTLPDGLTIAQVDSVILKSGITKGQLLDTTLTRSRTTLSRENAVIILNSWFANGTITETQYYATLGLKPPPALSIKDLPTELILQVGEDTTIRFSVTSTSGDSAVIQTEYSASNSKLLEWTLSGTKSVRTLAFQPTKDTGGITTVTITATEDGSTKSATISITIIDTVLDVDGNTYHYRLMPDGKRWMTSNLYTRADSSDTCAGGIFGRTADCKTYGRLYRWSDAMALPTSCIATEKDAYPACASQITAQHRGLCPKGWHVATNTEWSTLFLKTADSDDSTYHLKSQIPSWPAVYSADTGYYNGSGKYGTFIVPTEYMSNYSQVRGAAAGYGAWLPEIGGEDQPFIKSLKFLSAGINTTYNGFTPKYGSLRCIED